MANVKVRFSAMFKDVTGIGETDIEIEGKTVENLIEVLTHLHNKGLALFVISELRVPRRQLLGF